jgi:hypothetical protein
LTRDDDLHKPSDEAKGVGSFFSRYAPQKMGHAIIREGTGKEVGNISYHAINLHSHYYFCQADGGIGLLFQATVPVCYQIILYSRFFGFVRQTVSLL